MLKMILSVILVYFLIVGLFYLAQRQFIYYPFKGSIEPKKWGMPEMKLIQLKTPDNLALNAWYHPPQSTMPTLLFFHGNAGHIGHRASKIKPYVQAGYGVLLLGYRGYSGNKGHPSEKGLYIDARTAINFLHMQKISSQCIVLIGTSLGTGVAVQMATEFPVGAVVLESSYTSLVDVAKKHYPFFPVDTLMKDRFESIKKIHKLKMPLLFIHAEKDRIVPIESGIKLYEKALQPKTIKTYPYAGHNSLPDFSDVVIQFLKQHKICLNKSSPPLKKGVGSA